MKVNADDAIRVGNCFKTDSVLVSWSVSSCGGSREDKSVRGLLADRLNATEGRVRCVRDHLSHVIRSKVNEYSGEGRKILSEFGVAWGGGAFIVPMLLYVRHARPKLMMLVDQYHRQVEIWADNWHLIIDAAKQELGDSFDPSILPQTRDAVIAAFKASFDVMQVPQVIETRGMDEETTAAITDDVERTVHRKMDGIVDGMLGDVRDLAQRIVEIGKKMEKRTNGHDQRSLRAAKKHLHGLLEKARLIRGEQNTAGWDEVEKLVESIDSATKDTWDNDALADIIGGD